jgi:hypothetical protein
VEGHRASGGVAFGRGLAVLFIFIVNVPCTSLCRAYIVFSPYYIRLCSPPPVERRATSGQAPLQRGWKQHVQEFPRLARMARQHLTVPATSASPERLFSSVGFVKSDLRGRLLDSTLIDVMWVKQVP